MQIDAQRRRLGAATVPGLIIIAVAALAGCSGSGSSSASGAAPSVAHAPADSASAPASASLPFAGGQKASGAAGAGQAASATRLAPASQQLIYTAQLTVRATNVSTTISRATSIVATAGGYVSAENSSSDPNHPAQSTATVTLKIPAAVYTATLSELTRGSLGTQLSLEQQAQDVTEQVADVTSRVASDEAAITQLRALLKHAGTVGDLLSVQDQINTEESDLEAMQAQQTALNRETAYATVTLTILGPKAVHKPVKPKPKPEPGLVSGLIAGWHAFRVSLSWLLAFIGAVAPFAAVIAVLGALGYWGRRWFTRRRPAA
jgi:hypothetical protein